MRASTSLVLLVAIGCNGKDDDDPTNHSHDTDTDTVIGTDTTTDTDTTTPAVMLPMEELVSHPDAALMAVAGADGDVWMVGGQPEFNGQPLVLRSEAGGDFEPLEVGALHDLWWVHAFSSDEVFLGGGGATVLRFDGTEFERTPTPGFAGHTIYGMWGPSGDDLWAVGGFAGRDPFAWHYDGMSWDIAELPLDLPRDADGEVPALFKVWGRSTDDVYFVGGVGTILHWDGTEISRVESGTTEQLFTVSGNEDSVFVVGGGSTGIVLEGDVDGFTDITPPGAPLLQALDVEGDDVFIGGAGGFAAYRTGGAWDVLEVNLSEDPESIHAMWHDGTDLWFAGGGVLTPALDLGVAGSTAIRPTWMPEEVTEPVALCPADGVDLFPSGSMARRWNEQLLNSIRRDIPDPPKHARNLLTTSVAMFDAWAAYQLTAEGVVSTERIAGSDEDAEIAVAHAAYRVLTNRYANANGASISLDCYDKFMDVLGLDATDTHTTGDDPVAVGNRIGEAVLADFLDDGANEANGYVDTTGWSPFNSVLIIDRPGNPVEDINVWQQLNLGTAETQNGIVLESSVQPYIGPHWREVRPFALERDPVTGLYSVGADTPPTVEDPDMIDWVMEVIRKTSELDHLDGVMIDIGPATLGNNTLGANDGLGHTTNPATGLPYEPNMVPRGDFTRVVAESWADGPTSETPPGHWCKLANEASDAMDPGDLIPFGEGGVVDRLAWDVGLYLAVTGSTHDAAISAWELKRDSLGPRPVSLIRWMADNGQRTDSSLPSYHPDGLALEDGVVELITEESSAPGQPHHHLRYYVGELAVWSWPGEPGDRADDVTEFRWMRARDWIPYQRRTFVSPAFPGYTSGHSTFSRAAAEALTAYTNDPYFPGGMGSYTAYQSDYLVFEDGPSMDVTLQWATYYDAADQAGQSRLWGGIHIWPDDYVGRLNGSHAGIGAAQRAREHVQGLVE